MVLFESEKWSQFWKKLQALIRILNESANTTKKVLIFERLLNLEQW